MEREVGGGIGMGNTCKPMADSFQCMTKPTTIKKKKFRVCTNLLKILSKAHGPQVSNPAPGTLQSRSFLRLTQLLALI